MYFKIKRRLHLLFTRNNHTNQTPLHSSGHTNYRQKPTVPQGANAVKSRSQVTTTSARSCPFCSCYFLPERDYVTFGSLLSQFRLSSVVCLSVTLVHPTQGVEPFGKISSPLCTLAIFWPPCKILRRQSQRNPSVGTVKRKRGIKIQRFWSYRRYINGTR